MKLTREERNGIIIGTFVGLVAGFMTGQWYYMAITIAVGYVVGRFLKR